jgi:hypothetical protein
VLLQKKKKKKIVNSFFEKKCTIVLRIIKKKSRFKARSTYFGDPKMEYSEDFLTLFKGVSSKPSGTPNLCFLS